MGPLQHKLNPPNASEQLQQQQQCEQLKRQHRDLDQLQRPQQLQESSERSPHFWRPGRKHRRKATRAVRTADGAAEVVGIGSLIERIKDGQRTDPRFKTAWIRFCNQVTDGIRDPAKHPTTLLASFMELVDTRHVDLANQTKTVPSLNNMIFPSMPKCK